MKNVRAYYIKSTLDAKNGNVRFVVDIPINQLTQRTADDKNGFDEIACWDNETKLSLSVFDAQLSLFEDMNTK